MTRNKLNCFTYEGGVRIASLLLTTVFLVTGTGHLFAQDQKPPPPAVAPIENLRPVSPISPLPSAEVAPQESTTTPSGEQGVSPTLVSTAPAGSALLPQDLSPWGMFMQADVIVKMVIIGLVFASFVTWTVWLGKGLELAGAKRKARSATRKLQRSETLSEASKAIDASWTRSGAVADLVRAAERELERSSDLSAEGVKERLAIALSRIEASAGRNMTRGTGLLATIGATAPFVGLFGTVWGIMNSFIGISKSHTTNLAVVAPGIAEALLATAIGLVAAIPAVIIYNVFARAIAGYRALLSDASGEILQHLSRDLERAEIASAHCSSRRSSIDQGHGTSQPLSALRSAE
jgi:biopolymer transport protein ExbB